MTAEEIENNKRRADLLVASYGPLRLSRKMEEAVEHLAEIWNLGSIDLQILRPSMSLAVSKSLAKAVTFATGSSKSAATGVITKHAKGIAQASGGIAGKAAEIANRTKDAQASALAATKMGVAFIKRRPVGAAFVGAGVGASAIWIGLSLKRQLRHFNDACYRLHLERIQAPRAPIKN